MIDENYPDPRSRRDRAGRRAELRDRLRPWGLPGYPQLSVDFRKIAEALPSFKPSWTVRSGVEELYKAYTSAGLTSDDWTGWRYYRLQRSRRRGH